MALLGLAALTLGLLSPHALATRAATPDRILIYIGGGRRRATLGSRRPVLYSAEHGNARHLFATPARRGGAP